MFQKLLFAIVLFPTCIFAQEVVTPLAYNPILKAQYPSQQQKSKAKQTHSTFRFLMIFLMIKFILV